MKDWKTTSKRKEYKMATFLTPDKTVTFTVGNETRTIKQRIIPNSACANKDVASYVKKGQPIKPCKLLGKGTATEGKLRGICIHNTNDISVAAGTNPAEQYSRATWPNCNMGGVVVHFYVYKNEIWQNLSETEQGWHAADGSSRRTTSRPCGTIGGNVDTIAIEVIESKSVAETEKTAALLTAYLLSKHGLETGDIYSHNYFYSKKKCPIYILPHWDDFKKQCSDYLALTQKKEEPATAVPSKTSIMGKSECTATQLDAYAKSKNSSAFSIGEIFIKEGESEGVRGDIAFCQSCLETGYFKFGGAVSISQNNFCGLGATGGGVSGASFASVTEGVRAQIQHLKAYANKDSLVNSCVDPRFSLVTRGIAPNWEDLNGRWAVPGTDYGERIVKIWNAIKSTSPPKADLPAEKEIYRVQVGAFAVKANAEAMLAKVKAAGFDAFIAESNP
jgi:N-acetylmuramoyl-L-alanine amidase CwlA